MTAGLTVHQRMPRPTAGALIGETDFRVQTTQYIALAVLLFVAPFGLYNAIIGRTALGSALFVLTVAMLTIAWRCRNAARVRLLPSLGMAVMLVSGTVLATVELRATGWLWCYPAVMAIYCIVPERWANATNLLMLGASVPVLLRVTEPEFAFRAIVTLVVTSLFSAILIRVISIQQDDLRRAVTTDFLTGCLNRVNLEPTMEATALRARTTGEPASLLALDIDHFKRINDQLGHAAGDRVLQCVGDLLREHRRTGEHVFRTGGEEFLWLMPATGEREARARADALRMAVAATRTLPDRTVTISIGGAILGDEDTGERWAHRADEALYEAKGDGRDRFALAA